MKSLLLVVFTTFCFSVQAKYSIKGTIENGANQEVFIYTYINNMEILTARVPVDSKGDFVFKSKENYDGIVNIMPNQCNNRQTLFVNNDDIVFKGVADNSTFKITEVNTEDNTLYYQFNDLKNNSKKIELLTQLQGQYSPSDTFYQSITDQIKKLSTNPNFNTSKYPFLTYYLNLQSSILDKQVYSKEDAEAVANEIVNHFVNDSEDLEKTFLMNNLLSTYLSYKLSGYNDADQQMKAIKPAIDTLLEATVIESTRGQNTLVSFIKILNGYGLEFISEEYVKKAESLTCTISDELKSTIAVNTKTQVGSTFENFNFTSPKNGAKSLYDIKSNYKLVIFWGSFCPHCQHEKPLIKAFNTEFKMKGGEIISFGIEKDKKEYENFISGIDWISDTDFMFWNSPVVMKYGIEGTPSMFLLDKDNKIIARGAQIDVIKSSIN